ncbi:hypothetical protein MAR_012321, partial [Mya arenaria]
YCRCDFLRTGGRQLRVPGPFPAGAHKPPRVFPAAGDYWRCVQWRCSSPDYICRLRCLLQHVQTAQVRPSNPYHNS